MLDPAALLRAVRRSRRLSQRELAEVSGVPANSIDRIEAGRTATPSLRIVERILESTGYQFVIVNAFGAPLVLDVDEERLYDAVGRHFPAHLRPLQLGLFTVWRGWQRAPYYDVRVRPPEWIYRGRIRAGTESLPWVGDSRWDDAT